MGTPVAEFRAKTLKRRGGTIIPVTIKADDGSDLTIDCRRPDDLLSLAANGLLAWPALQAVFAITRPATPKEGEVDNRPEITVVDKAEAFGALLDEWVCAAAVDPPVVKSAADVRAQQGEALSLSDIPFDGRLAIWAATVPGGNGAVAEFRGAGSGGAVDRPGGEAVRDAAIADAASPGPAPGAGD